MKIPPQIIKFSNFLGTTSCDKHHPRVRKAPKAFINAIHSQDESPFPSKFFLNTSLLAYTNNISGCSLIKITFPTAETKVKAHPIILDILLAIIVILILFGKISNINQNSLIKIGDNK